MFDDLDSAKFRGQAVGIATGGSSQEREISLKTGAAFETALKAKGYDVTVFDVAGDLDKIVAQRPAAMLLGIHGGIGEGGVLQGFLESLRIPYTGSGVLASALAMDKSRARIVCAAAGVPVARGRSFSPAEMGDLDKVYDEIVESFDFPVVAKLNDSGSSFGVYICEDASALQAALSQLQKEVGTATTSAVLVESFLLGPEYSVGFFDDQALGVMEIIPAGQFYDYEAKYQSGETVYKVVDEKAVSEPLVALGRRAFRALGCRGVARIDFKGRPDQLEPFGMLEVNTIPGMTATSLVPKLAANKGVRFEDFVEAMLSTARLEDV